MIMYASLSLVAIIAPSFFHHLKVKTGRDATSSLLLDVTRRLGHTGVPKKLQMWPLNTLWKVLL